MKKKKLYSGGVAPLPPIPTIPTRTPMVQSMAAAPISMPTTQVQPMANQMNTALSNSQNAAVQGLSSALGPLSALATFGYNMYQKDRMEGFRDAKKGWSPGMAEVKENYYDKYGFSTGGDVQLSNNSFQVKGNPQTTDGNYYPALNAKLDHNEVVTNANSQPFVFSDVLKDPQTNKSFAELAKVAEKSKGKAQERLNRNPYDELSKNTLAQSEALLNRYATTQERLAASKGLRNPDGSTVQKFATGGWVDISKFDSEKLKAVQLDLKNKGLYKGKIDGIYGPLTEAAYKAVAGNQPENIQYVGGRGFDSNKVRQGDYGELVATDMRTKEDFGVIKNIYNKMKKAYWSGGYWQDPQNPVSPSPVIFGQLMNQYGTPPAQNSMMNLPFEGMPTQSTQQYPSTSNVGQTYQQPTPVKVTASSNIRKTPKSKYVDPVGPEVITNNPLGMSIPLDGSHALSVSTRNVFGEPQVTTQTLWTGANPEAWKSNLNTLPNRLNGQSYRITDTDKGTSLALTKPDGSPYGATDRLSNPMADQAITSLRNLTSTPTTSAKMAAREDLKYRTPVTAGDVAKFIELIGKSEGLAEGPEIQKAYADKTMITKRAYDPRQALQSNQRNYRNTLNNYSGNINLRRALQSQALVSKMNSDNQVLSQYQQMNNQANADYEQRLSGQRQFNINSQYSADNINAANRGAYDNAKQNFYSSVGQFGEDMNRKRYSQDAMRVLAAQYPGVYAEIFKLIK